MAVLRIAIAGLLLLAACRETRVEVSTEVDLLGQATRTVEIRSFDGDEPADHPGNLMPPAMGYQLLEEEPGRLRAAGTFGDLSQAAPAFGFRSEALDRLSADEVSFRSTDWVLFRMLSFSETIRDVVEPDEVQAALEEAADLGIELLEGAFAEAFGEDFDHTVLRARLRGDLRRMLREATFVLWRELQTEAGQDLLERRLAARLSNLARRYGLHLDPEWLLDWAENGEEAEGLRATRRAVAAWIGEGLEPREQGGRRVLMPDLDTFLFEGPFEDLLLRQVQKKFGSLTGGEDYLRTLEARVFGLFGAGGGDLTFVLRVKMPGQLLRSNGYLGRDGWTFVEFRAPEAYPRGAGLACESVVWDFGAIGALAVPGLTTDNETALDWMLVLAGSAGEAPAEAVLELVRGCVRARSLAPLAEHLASLEPEDGRRPHLQRLLDWLSGRRA